ncbi:MAG: YciC family protein [Polyangiaceae bacterium]
MQPYAPPAAPYPGPPAPPGPTGQAPLRFEITEVISGAWAVFTRQWMPLCVAMLIVGLIVAVPMILVYVVGMLGFIAGSQAAIGGGDPDGGVIALAMFGGVFGAMMLVMCLVMPLFTGRLLRMGLTAVRGGTPTVGDLFTGEMRYRSMLALMLLQGMLIGVGYLLFIVPGVILALGLYFSAYLVIDQRMGAVDAMKASWKLTTGRKGEVFIVMLVFGLLSAVCGMIPFVGHFIGYAMMLLGVSIVYLRLMGEWAPVLPQPQAAYPAQYGQQPYAPPYGGAQPPPAGGYGGYGPPYGGGPPPRV